MKVMLTIGKGDSWGLGFEYYPCDYALTIDFLCFYLLIEKA